MRYYLAGPMTGLPKYGFDIFERAAARLRHEGFNIASPHEIDHGESEENRGSLKYQDYIRAGLKLLLECDAIILMTGWESSGGCMTELYVAYASDMKVYFYNPLTGILTTNAGRITKDAE